MATLTKDSALNRERDHAGERAESSADEGLREPAVRRFRRLGMFTHRPGAKVSSSLSASFLSMASRSARLPAH